MKKFYGSETIPLDGFRPCKKKPVTVHAMRIDTDFIVMAKEGQEEGKAGDYLMRGVRGELYPIDASIFEETYEFL